MNAPPSPDRQAQEGRHHTPEPGLYDIRYVQQGGDYRHRVYACTAVVFDGNEDEIYVHFRPTADTGPIRRDAIFSMAPSRSTTGRPEVPRLATPRVIVPKEAMNPVAHCATCGARSWPERLEAGQPHTIRHLPGCAAASQAPDGESTRTVLTLTLTLAIDSSPDSWVDRDDLTAALIEELEGMNLYTGTGQPHTIDAVEVAAP